jgi:hypothetical protein
MHFFGEVLREDGPDSNTDGDVDGKPKLQVFQLTLLVLCSC